MTFPEFYILQVQEKCRPLMDIESQDKMRVVTDDLFPSSHAWPMQLNSPFKEAFNEIILRLQAAGLFVKWNSDYSSASQMIPKSHQRHTRLFGKYFIKN